MTFDLKCHIICFSPEKFLEDFMKTNYQYAYDEVFENIPGDDENVLFNIPAEICTNFDLSDNTNIEVFVERGNIVIRILES